MHYVKQFDINNVATRQVACIELHGKPNAATEGCVGVLGIDVDSPTHDVYKCVAVNGSIYTWELLSSGLSIMSATISGEGAESVQFPYIYLRTPAMYMLKVGDLILDKEGYLYQIIALNSEHCDAIYSGTQVVAYGKSAYDLAVKNGFKGSEEEWVASLKGTSVTVSKVDESTDDGGNNVVTFSDGKTLQVKNGRAGSDASVTATNIKTALGYTPAKLQSPNDMLHNGNEFTFIPDGYEGQIYINHRTASGQANGNVSNYYFGNGKGGLATFIAGYFKGKFQGDTARLIYNNAEVAMLSDVPSKTETWTFTLEDGSVVTKAVYVG